jgi:hypothetical protein
VELLKLIKLHALKYDEHRYKKAIILESLKVFINLRKKENDSAQDYTKLFETARDVLKSHMGGHIILLKYITQMDIFDKTNPSIIEQCHEKAFNQFLANNYFENSDKTKYGTLLTRLQTQQLLKIYQYLFTLTEGNKVLSNHKHGSFNTSNKAQKINNYNNYTAKEVLTR